MRVLSHVYRAIDIIARSGDGAIIEHSCAVRIGMIHGSLVLVVTYIRFMMEGLLLFLPDHSYTYMFT